MISSENYRYAAWSHLKNLTEGGGRPEKKNPQLPGKASLPICIKAGRTRGIKNWTGLGLVQYNCVTQTQTKQFPENYFKLFTAAVIARQQLHISNNESHVASRNELI